MLQIGFGRFLRGRHFFSTQILQPVLNQAKINSDEKINEVLSASKNNTDILHYSKLKEKIKHDLIHYQNSPKIHIQSLPKFSSLLNGLRPGELTVLTGPTGCGKTTILSQISLDYCMQGIRILWGSFEIRNSRLSQVILQQLLRQPLFDQNGQLDDAAFEHGSSLLSNLPMHFFNLFGSTDMDTVLISMENAMENAEIRPDLIILDNLQFMLSGQSENSLDKYEIMDRAIASLRLFCNQYDTHVVVVVHPRKEMDGAPLGIASVSGTPKATQEADNVIVLQKLADRRFIDLKKNRFHGSLGRVEITFDPNAKIINECE